MPPRFRWKTRRHEKSSRTLRRTIRCEFLKPREFVCVPQGKCEGKSRISGACAKETAHYREMAQNMCLISITSSTGRENTNFRIRAGSCPK